MIRSTDPVVRRCLLGLFAVAVTVSFAASALADPEMPSSLDRFITKQVVSMMSRQHFSKHPLDDELSKRWLTSFLKSLDPWKVYFYQSDVDRFNQRETELDDLVRKGDVTFAHEVFQTFLARIDQRVATIDELLAMDHDFTVDEEMLSDRDLAQYPRTEAEAYDKWRKRIKYDLLVLKADAVSDAEKQQEEAPDAGAVPKKKEDPLERLTRRYHSFQKRMHQIDSGELLEMYLTAMTSSFDPHTSYMSPDTYENFKIMLRLQLDGIGASLQSEDGYTIIRKIIPGGAADKDGRLKTEDKIVGVRQSPDAEMVDTIDMKLSDVVKMIRGKRGTVVELEVQPGDGSALKTIKITRAKIELKDEEAQSAVFEAGKRPDGRPFKIGVIDLPSFYMDMDARSSGFSGYKSTTKDVRKILEQFNAAGVDALILDLRRNGGGSLTEAIDCTGLFIEKGPVVQVRDALNEVRAYSDSDPNMVWSRPMIVLTSKFSASASEILAGAIQDYRRGLIVGDHATHGKGTVQSLADLSKRMFLDATPMGALKITIQQFYRPSGDSTQQRGVLADIELPSLTTHLDVGEADLDYPVEFDRIQPAGHKSYGMVNPALSNRLAQLSAQRLQQSDDFRKVLKRIERYKEQKAKKYVTLNEQEFLAERAELNADKEEEKTIEKLNDPNQVAIERDYYLDEALSIAVDLLNLQEPVAQAWPRR